MAPLPKRCGKIMFFGEQYVWCQKLAEKLIGVQTRWALGFGKSSSASSKIMALLPLGEPKKCTRDGYGIFHSLALCKKYGTFALGRAKNWYRKRSRSASSKKQGFGLLLLGGCCSLNSGCLIIIRWFLWMVFLINKISNWHKNGHQKYENGNNCQNKSLWPC